MSLDAVLSQIDQDLDPALERLMALLRLQSVSTDPAYAPHCQAAADWLVADLRSLGVEAEAHQTPGHPIVVGHADGPGPHLMFYGHYDVQPVDPLELWEHPPFEPDLADRGGRQVIRGRGAADDKGQLMTFLEACRAWKAVHGTLPCKLTFFFEGEEESGSPSLVPFLEQHKATLSAPDLTLICDTGLFDAETPAISTQLRGMLTTELTIQGPSRDLHSGHYGGIAMNPIRVLSGILAGLHDDSGRVTIPGFYEGVPELTNSQRTQWEGLGFDQDAFLAEVGLSKPAGEAGRTGLEMIWARPTAEVNGIWGGYTGAGFKTVLPSEAHAKISFRLVGTQDPDAIRDSLEAMVHESLPEDCTATFHHHGGAPASHMDIARPEFEKARQALSDEWPNPAAFIGMGGSIPIAGHFKDILGIDSMLIGFGLEDDQIHSPNEKYNVSSFHKGARSWARVLAALTA